MTARSVDRIPLSELITLQRGFDLPESERKEGQIPVVASTGINGYHNEEKVSGPGVVIGRSGSIGGGQYIDENFWPLNTTLWVKDFKGNSPRFVYYVLRNIDFSRFNAGAGVPTLNRNHLATLSVPKRSNREQRRIADILAAYDDLIENNRRRIRLIEQSALQLYKDWFVRLRFPGHEHVKVIDGVPIGWETHLLDNLCTIGRGASPRPIANYMGGTIPWFKIGDATSSESCFILQAKEHVTEDGATKSVSLRPGALVLSNSATCGIPFFIGVSGCVHDGWLHFSEYKRVTERLLYCYLYFKRDQLVASVGEGSTQKNLNTAAVGRLEIILPRRETLLAQFDETVQPVFSMVLNLARQNISLAVARDLLLPRLMSGEITV
jgi:type I restriction enzyme S subunit